METREQAEQAAVRWVARRESGEWGEHDEAEFAAWLEGSTTRRIAYYRFKNTWHEAGRLKVLADGPLPTWPLSRAFDDASAIVPEKRGWLVRALAACVALVVVTLLLVHRDEFLGGHTYATPLGGLSTFPMPDGSRVTLNTDSRLRVSMNDRERRIELMRGEAYFEVAKDPLRPFVVTAAGKRVIAVGTQFAVRRQGEDIRVSVTEGIVRFVASPAVETRGVSAVEDVKRGSGLLLTAGTVASAKNVGVVLEEKPLDSIQEQLTWRTGVLTFRDTPLVEAVAELNRYNQRKIFIEDPSIAAIEVGGVFRSTDLDPFIRLIEGGLALRVEREGDHIILSAEH